MDEERLGTLTNLSPRVVANYLETSGWLQRDSTQKVTLWTFQADDGEFEALLPVDATLRDYPARMSDLVRLLSAAEERTDGEVLRDLLATTTDTQYFRTHPDTPSGTIPVAEAISTLTGVRDLMIAGAYAVLGEPALVLPKRKPKRVERFPDHVRIGPSAAGSYVITAEVPLEAFDDGALFHTVPPLGRRVMLRLYDTIRRAHAAADEALETSELDAFADGISEGISTTLCRALTRFGGADTDRPFEVRFSWGSALPPGITTTPIRFAEDQVTMLAQAAEDLGERRIVESATVRGRVWRTERDHPDSLGLVVIRGVAVASGRQRPRYAWMLLPPEDFNRALQAAEYGLTVVAEGTLVRTGRRTELTQLRAFEVTDLD